MSDSTELMAAMLYFAYGSNMDVQQMEKRDAQFTERRKAKLRGYVLKFNKKATGRSAKEGEGKGNMVCKSKGIVEGALYEVTEKGLRNLDNAEGFPKHYDRRLLEVILDDGTRAKAWAYLAQPSMVAEGLKPTKRYLDHYLKGRDLLSPEYYHMLENVETLD